MLYADKPHESKAPEAKSNEIFRESVSPQRKKIIAQTIRAHTSQREGRMIDSGQSGLMKKLEGYF